MLSWIALACRQKMRHQLAYNGTHLFLAFSFSTDDSWDINLDYVDGRQLCVSPYLTGRVHCGFLKAAWTRVALFMNSNMQNTTDVCLPLLGYECGHPVHWVVGGMSQGSGVLQVFMMIMDRLYETIYGLDWLAGMKSAYIALWSPVGFADSEFHEAYRKRFGSITHAYAHEADVLYRATALLIPHDEVHATIFSEDGTCGGGRDERTLRDCVQDCTLTDPTSLANCVAASLVLLAQSPFDAHLTSVLQGSDVAFVNENEKQEESLLARAGRLGAVLYERAQTTFTDLTTSATNPYCIEPYMKDSYFASVCGTDILDDPWEPHAAAAVAQWSKGPVTKWCIAMGMRLRARIAYDGLAPEELDEWGKICCDTRGDNTTIDTFISTNMVIVPGPFVEPPPLP